MNRESAPTSPILMMMVSPPAAAKVHVSTSPAVAMTSNTLWHLVQLRVLFANGDSCEVTFTLFRLPGMDDEKFTADAAWVKRDLQKLKDLLEAQLIE